MRIRRCPKCRALPVRYVEVLAEFTTTFEAKQDGRPEEEGWHSEGYPTHVLAYCVCKHRWRLRGVLQITDLSEDA